MPILKASKRHESSCFERPSKIPIRIVPDAAYDLVLRPFNPRRAAQ